jgi:hypothetical protein
MQQLVAAYFMSYASTASPGDDDKELLHRLRKLGFANRSKAGQRGGDACGQSLVPELG